MAHKKGVGSSKNGRESESKKIRRKDIRRICMQGRQHHCPSERNCPQSGQQRRNG